MAHTIEVVGALRSCALALPVSPLGLQFGVTFPGSIMRAKELIL